MVPLKELRIGNLVSNHIDREMVEPFYQVKYYDFDSGRNKYFEPIPLTPEVLEKCGFTKANEEGVTTFTLEISKENIAPSGDNEYKLFGIKSKGTNSIQIDYTVNRYWAAKSIHYLHELQNLYLWITGEELEIKL